jgi:hypothetical protein
MKTLVSWFAYNHRVIYRIEGEIVTVAGKLRITTL